MAAPRVLEQVVITGKIITGDALHAQRALSAQIVERGGDYLWVVKENQERLYQDIERLFAPDKPKPGFGGSPQTSLQNESGEIKDNGRIEKRCIQTSALLNDYVDWPGLGQVYRLERRFTWMRQGKVIKASQEMEYGITSLTREKASPQRVLQIRRKHWRIETGLHYRQDVTFANPTRMTKGAAGQILATIHNVFLALIKQAGFHYAAQARRWFAGHLDQAFALLVLGNSRL